MAAARVPEREGAVPSPRPPPLPHLGEQGPCHCGLLVASAPHGTLACHLFWSLPESPDHCPRVLKCHGSGPLAPPQCPWLPCPCQSPALTFPQDKSLTFCAAPGSVSTGWLSPSPHLRELTASFSPQLGTGRFLWSFKKKKGLNPLSRLFMFLF